MVFRSRGACCVGIWPIPVSWSCSLFTSQPYLCGKYVSIHNKYANIRGHFYIHATFESKWPSIHSLKTLPPFFCTMASRDNQGRRLRAGLTSLLLACCRGTLACAHVEPRCFFRWSTTSWTSTRIFFIRFARDDRRPFHRRTKCMKK